MHFSTKTSVNVPSWMENTGRHFFQILKQILQQIQSPFCRKKNVAAVFAIIKIQLSCLLMAWFKSPVRMKTHNICLWFMEQEMLLNQFNNYKICRTANNQTNMFFLP